VAIINAWAFPVRSIWVIAGMILLLAIVFLFHPKAKCIVHFKKQFLVSVSAMAFSFFLLNSNFLSAII
jgi:hypothetical protein